MLRRLASHRHSLLRRSLSLSSSSSSPINTHKHPPILTNPSLSPRSSSSSLLLTLAASSLLASYLYASSRSDHLVLLSAQMRATASAASVLCRSLRSVLSSANHGVRSGFETRVASFLADIAAANGARRRAIVGAGGGAVVDWLLETAASAGVGEGERGGGAQAEAARALAYLVADADVAEDVLGRPRAVTHLLRFIFASQPKRSKKLWALAYLVADADVAEDVLGRPRAVTHLLRFIFASQPKRSKKQSRRTSFDVSDSLKGRSMLVAALMDIITSNCDRFDKVSLKPLLPGNADMRDIAAAIQVIEEGGMHLDETDDDDDDDDGDIGIKGIGMKVLGGTQVVGLSRTSNEFIETANYGGGNILLNKLIDFSQSKENVTSAVVPGLWDDLLGQHVAVPFAAWALANWAMASDVNRAHIQELDQDGHAVWTALTTAERSVKWHGSLVARLLLEDQNLPLNDSVPDWSFSLLSTVAQASKSQDIPLAQVALSAFLVSMKRSPAAHEVVMEKGLHLMRETAKYTIKHKPVQEALAKALESLLTADVHMSLEESQMWSGVLISWIFGDYSSDAIRASATKILSRIFEDYGPSSIPISQGWLALLLADILGSSKAKSAKGSTPPKINKVKTQIDQANIVSAQQIVNQLANAVVNLAGKQLGEATSGDTSPLAELLNLEPFAAPLKNLKKDSMQKFDAADSAYATLKGIKALTELCAEDAFCQNKIADYGILCLLRRFLLQDDYEQLAAIEAYDASRAKESQDEPSARNSNESSSVRVPPTAHIRRHAARLLTVLSVLPKVQKVILEDEVWCKWLEDCACGKISGCDDVKIQSYARATLLNTFCNDSKGLNSSNEDIDTSDHQNRKHKCPHYSEMIFLINPDQSHWKCPDDDVDTGNGTPPQGQDTDDVASSSSDEIQRSSRSDAASLDVVFVHGLRGGPFKTWRLSEDKSSTKSGLVEKIDEEAGKQGTFWPGEWLSADFPHARLFTLKYKTNLTQWSGATLPLQEVSSMLLEKLVDAGIGHRPVVFVTHSMGGLVVKQMLYQAKAENKDDLVNNAVGLVFYSCPHFGSKLADMPWRMGLVLRPAPTIGELRSGSPRLVELNDYIRNLHKKGLLDVLSFCETKVTPIVEGYGGWAFRMEIVPIESAYPGFGELVVLESTDHVNSCKPVSPNDPSYKEILGFLKKLKAQL